MNRFCKKVVDLCLPLSDFQTRESRFLRRTFSPGLSKAHFTCPLEQSKETFFRKSFLADFKAWGKIFWFFVDKISTGLSNMRFTCLEEHFEEKNFPEKFSSFQSFSETERSIFGFLSRIFSVGLLELCSTCLQDPFKEKIFFGVFLSVSDVDRKVSAFCQNCFPGVHRNKVSRKTFRWKPYIFLFRHWAENFQFCPKVFWLGCQNCIPPGNRIILRRSILFEFSPHLFRTLSKNSSGFCRIFIYWVDKTAFFVSRRNFRVE